MTIIIAVTAFLNLFHCFIRHYISCESSARQLIHMRQKIRHISCESSARQRIHRELHALFSSEDKSNKIIVSSV